MPNPYLYVVVALVVVLVVVGAYLGMMVSNEAAKAATLQNQLNALKTNYTTLESQYTQLQSQYTTLQNQYNQLQTQYNELESNYTALQSQYNQLQNYAGAMNTVSFYKSIITPVAYVYEGQGVNAFFLYLNITNPTSNKINMTLDAYAGPPISGEVLQLPTHVIVPPGITLELPAMWVMYNSTYMSYSSFFGIGGGESGTFNTGMFEHMNVTITVLTNELTNLGLSGFAYNTTIVKVVNMNQPIGYAEYSPSSPGQWWTTSFNLEILNPLPTGVTINYYELYAYNGTPLTTCTLVPSITINATSVTSLYLPTESQTNYYLGVNWYTLENGWEWGGITISQVICSPNYWFPTSTAQLPFGYVVLNTSVGNVTIPLLPYPWSW